MITKEKNRTKIICAVVTAISAIVAGGSAFQLYNVQNISQTVNRMCGSFSSSVFNHRTDEYGGSAENRARFAVESVRAVRSRLPELPIDYKLAVRQEEPHYGNAGVVESELEILCQCSLVPVSPVFM